MTVYHRRQLTMTLAEDEDFAQTLFSRARSAAALSDLLEEASYDRFKLTDAVGEVAVDLGGVTTIKLLFVEVDGACDVKVDGAAVAVQVRPSTGEVGVLLMEAIEATSLSVQNPTASSETNVTLVVAGD